MKRDRIATKPTVVRGVLRVRAWPVLCDAVESGVILGWNRAHKHTDKPTPETIREEIEQAVESQISEAFDFPRDDDSANT